MEETEAVANQSSPAGIEGHPTEVTSPQASEPQSNCTQGKILSSGSQAMAEISKNGCNSVSNRSKMSASQRLQFVEKIGFKLSQKLKSAESSCNVETSQTPRDGVDSSHDGVAKDDSVIPVPPMDEENDQVDEENDQEEKDEDELEHSSSSSKDFSDSEPTKVKQEYPEDMMDEPEEKKIKLEPLDDQDYTLLKEEQPAKRLTECSVSVCISPAWAYLSCEKSVYERVKQDEKLEVFHDNQGIPLCRSHHKRIREAIIPAVKCSICEGKVSGKGDGKPLKYSLEQYNNMFKEEGLEICLESKDSLCHRCKFVYTRNVTKRLKHLRKQQDQGKIEGDDSEEYKPVRGRGSGSRSRSLTWESVIKTRRQVSSGPNSGDKNRNPTKTSKAHPGEPCAAECSLCSMQFGEYDQPEHPAIFKQESLKDFFEDYTGLPMHSCICIRCKSELQMVHQTLEHSGDFPEQPSSEQSGVNRLCNVVKCSASALHWVPFNARQRHELQNSLPDIALELHDVHGHPRSRIDLCKEHYSLLKGSLIDQDKCFICETGLQNNNLFAPFRRNVHTAGKSCILINNALRAEGKPIRVKKDSKLCRHCYDYWLKKFRTGSKKQQESKATFNDQVEDPVDDEQNPSLGEENDMLETSGVRQQFGPKGGSRGKLKKRGIHRGRRLEAALRNPNSPSRGYISIGLEKSLKLRFLSLLNDEFPTTGVLLQHMLRLEDQKRLKLGLSVYQDQKPKLEAPESQKQNIRHPKRKNGTKQKRKCASPDMITTLTVKALPKGVWEKFYTYSLRYGTKKKFLEELLLMEEKRREVDVKKPENPPLIKKEVKQLAGAESKPSQSKKPGFSFLEGGISDSNTFYSIIHRPQVVQLRSVCTQTMLSIDTSASLIFGNTPALDKNQQKIMPKPCSTVDDKIMKPSEPQKKFFKRKLGERISMEKVSDVSNPGEKKKKVSGHVNGGGLVLPPMLKSNPPVSLLKSNHGSGITLTGISGIPGLKVIPSLSIIPLPMTSAQVTPVNLPPTCIAMPPTSLAISSTAITLPSSVSYNQVIPKDPIVMHAKDSIQIIPKDPIQIIPKDPIQVPLNNYPAEIVAKKVEEVSAVAPSHWSSDSGNGHSPLFEHLKLMPVDK